MTPSPTTKMVLVCPRSPNGSWPTDEAQTRKRAAENLHRNAKHLRISTGVTESKCIVSSGTSDATSMSSWHSSSSAASTDDRDRAATLDGPQMRLYAALAYIETHRMDLMHWSTANPDDIQRRSLNIWDNIQMASHDYAVNAEEPVSPSVRAAVESPEGLPDSRPRDRTWSTSRNVLFMETVGDVLRHKVFLTDIVARCRRVLPLEHSANECRVGTDAHTVTTVMYH